MNKISKKIVALATMAAFVLTLVPAAAFAAPTDKPVDSTVKVDDAVIATDESASVTVTVAAAEENDTIVLWVQDENGVYTDAKYTLNADGKVTANPVATTGTEWDNKAVAFNKKQAGPTTVEISFDKAGTYTVYAAADKTDKGDATAWKQLTPLTGNGATITVIPAADVDYSGYGVVTNGAVDETAAVNVGDTLNTRFVVNYDENTATDDQLGPVAIWAVAKGDKVGEVDTTVEFNGEKGSLGLLNVSNADPEKVEVTFNKAGTYTL